MNAVATVLAIVQAVRRRGVVVEFDAGWETRGNGMTAAYRGLVVHHTATPSSPANPCPSTGVLRSGRSDLRGPLCNFQGCADGRVRVIAAHPANHAGASGGRSMGPLPVTSLFNRHVIGLEVDYGGTTAMTPAARRAAVVLGAAVVEVLGVTPEHVRAHAETSVTGKWDPGWAPGKTIDMAAFRRDVANVGDEEAVSSQDIANAVLDTPLVRQGLPVGHPLAGQPTSPRAVLEWTDQAWESQAGKVDDLKSRVDGLMAVVTRLAEQAGEAVEILRDLRDRPVGQVVVDVSMVERAFEDVLRRTVVAVRPD